MESANKRPRVEIDLLGWIVDDILSLICSFLCVADLIQFKCCNRRVRVLIERRFLGISITVEERNLTIQDAIKNAPRNKIIKEIKVWNTALGDRFYQSFANIPSTGKKSIHLIYSIFNFFNGYGFHEFATRIRHGSVSITSINQVFEIFTQANMDHTYFIFETGSNYCYEVCQVVKR